MIRPMTVAELRDKLLEFPSHAFVILDVDHLGINPLQRLEFMPGQPGVVSLIAPPRETNPEVIG